MDFSDQDRALVNDLINIAWQSGAVKSPQMAALLEQLRHKLQQKTPAPSSTHGREPLTAVKND